MKHRPMPGLQGERSPEQVRERRADERYLTVYRVAKVLRAGDAGLWRVRNMSDRGMLLETGAAVVPNERLDIALSETIVLSGRVVWSSEGRCGIAFDKSICAGQVLRRLVEERETDGYRPLRLQVRCVARLLTDADEMEIMVTSISQFGAGFIYEGMLREAASVHLALADGVWRNGNLRWLRGSAAGLRLASPFALSELETVRGFACG